MHPCFQKHKHKQGGYILFVFDYVEQLVLSTLIVSHFPYLILMCNVVQEYICRQQFICCSLWTV